MPLDIDDIRAIRAKYIIVVFLALVISIAFNFGLFSFETFGPTGTKYEGPVQEFVAVDFSDQDAHSGWSSYELDGVYSEDEQPDKASVWNWADPNNVEIDVDGSKRGCPNLMFNADPFKLIDRDGEVKSRPDYVVQKIEYDIIHNGKTYRVQQYLILFRSYVKFSASGVEDLSGPLHDEINWNVACDVYLKLGINKWGSRAESDHIWAGILQVEVYSVDRNREGYQRSEVVPSSASQITMFSSVKGKQLGAYDFDDFKAGWQDPDRIPSTVYYKLRIQQFQVAKDVHIGKVVKPWAMFEVWCHVLVSHRFVLTKTNEAKYEDQQPDLGNDYVWELWLEDLLDQLGLDPTTLLILAAGLIVAFLLCFVGGAILLIVILKD